MNTEKLTWYVARSGGIVAWLLLAFGLILGLLLSSRILGRRASPAWILSIHRFLGGLSVIFTAVHVAAIMLDDFVSFGWADVLVPWHSEWNASAVAWGIIAMYLMIAIELTSFAMRRLPKNLWRAVHWSSAPLFILATLHGYQAGSDAGQAFMIAIIASMAVLTLLTVVRIVQARRSTEAKVDPRDLVEEARLRKEQRLGRFPDPVPAAATTSSWFEAEPEPEPASSSERAPIGPNMPAEPVRQRDPVASWAPHSETGTGTSWMLDPAIADRDAAPPPEEPERTRSWLSEDEPVFADSAPAFSEPEPVVEQPDPTPASPDPTPAFNRPEPRPPIREPEPVFVRPEPDAPAFPEPEPVAAQPPPTVEPEPVAADPPPTFEPEPVAADPTPVYEAEPAHAWPSAPEPDAPVWAAEPLITPTAEPYNPAITPESPAGDEPWWSPPEPEDAPVLVGAAAESQPGGESAFPRPAWSDDGPLAWVTAEPSGNPQIRRREGPVPGVWKRSKRDLDAYTERDN